MVELVKNGLETPEESFIDVDAYKFYVLKYSIIIGM